VRCVILTGAGDKAFCAGGDLKERNGMTDAVWRAQHAIFEEAFYAIMECSVPVIAVESFDKMGPVESGCSTTDGAVVWGGCVFACDDAVLDFELEQAGTENAQRLRFVLEL